MHPRTYAPRTAIHNRLLRLGCLTAVVASAGPPTTAGAAEPPPSASTEPPPALSGATTGGPDRSLSARIRPADLTVTLGALLPALLIYEFPGPWAGVELGWRTSAHTRLVANAGLGVVSMQGSQRYLAPVGFSLRASPWKNGPWAQVGLGAMPYVEHIRVALPQRTVSTTDIGAMLTCKVQLGVHLYNWEFALGTDENLLPRPFYKNYKGDETLPWGRTLLVWFGRRL